jgi:hypothetical protein
MTCMYPPPIHCIVITSLARARALSLSPSLPPSLPLSLALSPPLSRAPLSPFLSLSPLALPPLHSPPPHFWCFGAESVRLGERG